ncbi:MAG: DUF1080 domain-containing protein [Verrucomicrobia bacterium]|nr:DUF1080 domain-containing protein [Verrucomicrobiota bacterium]NBS05111.1 DUF1080 domain-containing protein [Verrucomicrobiota bacterium]NBY37778.1 DUF1080 domain-containing protein [Verrucomicrobiota bacterium]
MRLPSLLILLAAAGLVAAEGYTDTPLIPGTTWHVHDSARPQPPRADASKLKCNEAKAPAGAIVLVSGNDSASEWEPDAVPSAKLKTPTTWVIRDGVMIAHSNQIRTKRSFGDITLHAEWRSAEGYENDPKKKSQGSSNSGIFFMKTYELQVLDCWKNETYADGMTAAIYGQKPPLFNACLPSRSWNSYDVEWTAPRFNADGTVASTAHITVVMNGVKVQDNSEYIGPSSHKKNPPYVMHDDKMPLALQFHGDAVEYRNIWVVEKK